MVLGKPTSGWDIDQNNLKFVLHPKKVVKRWSKKDPEISHGNLGFVPKNHVVLGEFGKNDLLAIEPMFVTKFHPSSFKNLRTSVQRDDIP
jgi:hypothetical protein